MDLPERILKALARLQPRRLAAGNAPEAAVLMLMFEADGEPCFLLTRRTHEVRTHKGQISFPGGMKLAGESLQQTALRETYEEVGIDADLIRVLGRFHDYRAITGHLVAPFAGLIAGRFTVTPQRSEVAEVLTVPFAIFQDPGRLRTERRVLNGIAQEIYFYRYGSHEIWGLTAHIIKDFLEALQAAEP